ncbi:ABC transporter substrate-binding protein [Bifidobacterium ruminantium]|uniref:taurine ABC transporter substrate-binding protein n=1 Tax=Bifidobacterium ruminantium TaxID=78346 RepID=UPI0024933B25|nr:ABC transporter substrate-binding protein [Bifidobacterium ruminantium]
MSDAIHFPAHTTNRTTTHASAHATRLLGKSMAAIIAAGMLAGTTACGAMPTAYEIAGISPTGATATCPVDTNNDFTGTIRIAWQSIPNADLIVKDLGLLEACMPKATIQWNQFNSGGDVIQAFGSRSIDIGLAGSSPSVRAVSAPLSLPVKIVWIHDVIGEAESLVTNVESAKTIKDLAGKNIAVPFGSTSHFSLLSALSKAGMSETSVNLINLDPDKMAGAWNRKEIDAAWVWDPVLSKLEAADGHIVTSSAETAKSGSATYDMEIASTDFIKANPGAMKTWTTVENYAAVLLKTKPDSSAEAIASQLGTAKKDVLTQMKGYTYPQAKAQSESFHGELPAVLKSTAKFLKSQNSLDTVNDTYETALYTDAIDAVAK